MTATRVIAYAPNGASLGPIPTPQDLQVGYPLNDVGALALNYPPDAPRSELLGQPVELAVEVSWDQGLTWSEPASSRFMYLRDGRDPIKTGDAFAVEAAGYVLRLQKALVGWTGLNSEGVREFVTAAPGAILTALWDEAVARGALVGMTRTWTAAADTAGTPWPETFSIAYEPGKDLLAILTEMADAGWLDFRTQGRSLQVYVQDHPSGMGADRTTGANPVSLRYGRDLTEAPFRRTWEGLADTAMVAGDNATHLERTNAGAIAPWGRQETYVTASGVTDVGTLTVIADAALTLTANERTEHTFGLDFSAATHLPFRDYAPGEWVYAAVDGSGVQRMRVRQVTLTRDNDGAQGGNVVLNDRFLEADVLQARRISRITQGATQAGTGGQPGSSPGGNDILAPAQVLGLTASSAAYVENDGRVRSQVSLDWNDVTTNADGTVASDVDHYEVHRRTLGSPNWALVAETNLSQWSDSPYEPGTDWEFKVRAVDTVFNRGAFSAVIGVDMASDVTPPAPPSTPTVTSRLGTARVTWNGLNNVGGAMPADFAYVAVHVSTVNNFTPDASTRVGELDGPGYAVAGPLNYSTTYYARLVAYDTTGNPSAASAQAAFTVAALVDVSNFPDSAMTDLYARTGKFLDLTADNFSANLIEGMWLKAGAVSTEKLTVGSAGEGLVTNGNFGDGLEGWTLGGPAGYAYLENSPNYPGGRGVILRNGPGGYGDIQRTNAIPVAPGTTVYFRAMLAQVGATQALMRFTWLDSNLASVATSDKYVTPVSSYTARTRAEHVLAAPSNARYVRVQIFNYPPTASDTYVIVNNVSVETAVSDAQITEVSAGKIRTGVLQATERVVAGSLTGARAELNGTGFLAARADGTTTFQVTAADGIARIGGTTGTRIELSRETNIFESSQDWPIVKLWTQGGAGWFPGQVWATLNSGTPQSATTRISSPYFDDAGTVSDWTKAAVLNLTNRTDGTSQAYIQAAEVNLTANTYTLGSTSGSVDFNLYATNTFVVMQATGSRQGVAIDCGAGFGVVDIRARSGSGVAQPELRLDGNKVTVLPGSAGMWVGGTGGLVVSAGGLNVQGGGQSITGASNLAGKVNVIGNELEVSGSGNTVIIGNPPVGGSANVNWNTTNGRLRLISSTRRHKRNIVDLAVDVPAAESLVPRIYERLDWEEGDPTHEVGFIAEEAQERGLEPWVMYDRDGEVFSFDYFRWVVALQAIVRAHRAELEDLKADVATLKNRHPRK